MAEIKDKLITAENLKNAYDDNKRQITALKGDLENKVDITDVIYNLSSVLENYVTKQNVTQSWNENYGYYFSKITGELVEYEYGRMLSIPVNEHDIFDIKSRVGYREALWSMHNSNGDVVKWWKYGDVSLPTDYYEDLGVVIPNGVTELRVYADTGSMSGYVKKYNVKIKVDSVLNGKKWCAIGDSLTDSSTLSGESNIKNYVDFMVDNTGVIAINKGIGGTGYLNTNNGANTNFYERRNDLPTDADIYTIFGSFNDMNSFTEDTIGTIDSNTMDTLMGAMTLAIRAIGYINPRAVVAVILPTPWSSYNNTSQTKREKANKYIDALITICEKYSVPYLDLYHQSGLRPWDSNFNQIYYKDDNNDGNYSEGVHPNSLGHEIFIYPKVRDFLEKLIN